MLHSRPCILNYTALHCIALNSDLLNCQLNSALLVPIRFQLLRLSQSQSQSQNYVTTDGQSESLSWNKAPIWGL
jgi:hypothetical protein